MREVDVCGRRIPDWRECCGENAAMAYIWDALRGLSLRQFVYFVERDTGLMMTMASSVVIALTRRTSKLHATTPQVLSHSHSTTPWQRRILPMSAWARERFFGWGSKIPSPFPIPYHLFPSPPSPFPFVSSPFFTVQKKLEEQDV